MKSSNFDAEITFQSQGRSCNPFLAGATVHVMGCIALLKIFQLVKRTGWSIIFKYHFEGYFDYAVNGKHFSGHSCEYLVTRNIQVAKRHTFAAESIKGL